MKYHLMTWVLVLGTLAACSEDSAGPGTTIVTGSGFGEACTADINCRDGLSCIEDICTPAGDTVEGSACTLTAECDAALYCAPDSTCQPAGEGAIGESCSSVADCLPGHICVGQGFGMECAEAGSVDLNGACDSESDCMAGLGCTLGACAAGGGVLTPPVWQPVACESPVAGDARVFFELPSDANAEFFRLPYPNDVRRTASGLDLSGYPAPPESLGAGTLVREYMRVAEELTGFSLNPSITFRFSQSVDLDTLNDEEDNARFVLVDITAGDEDYGTTRGLSWAAAAGPGSGGLYICDNWLALRVPWGRPLAAGHTYATFLLKGVKASDQVTDLVADDDFTALMGSSRPSEAALAAAWDKYAPLRDFLAESEDYAASDLIGGTVFTTQTDLDIVPALREAVAAEAAPSISELVRCDEGVVSPCEDGLEGEAHRRGCFAAAEGYHELQGRVSLPIFQQGTAPYLNPEDGGAIALDAGAPQVVRREDVCLSMTVPKAEMPEAGWPLIIYAHGTGGNMRSHVENAFADLAAQLDGSSGAIVLGFDAVVHGDRRGESDRSADLLYFNYANPQAARGNILQGAADIFSLARLGDGSWGLSAEDSPTGEAIAIDPERVFLVAHSQGTHYGVVALPYEPTFDGALFSGAGGGLIPSLLEKSEPIDIASGIKLALADPQPSEHHPALNLVQLVFDQVDTVNHGRKVLYERVDDNPRPHYFHVYGREDHYTPERTQQALGVSVAPQLVTPVLADFGGVVETDRPVAGNFAGRTAVMVQYEADGNYDGHFVAHYHSQARADIAAFLSTWLTEDAPALE